MLPNQIRIAAQKSKIPGCSCQRERECRSRPTPSESQTEYYLLRHTISYGSVAQVKVVFHQGNFLKLHKSVERGNNLWFHIVVGSVYKSYAWASDCGGEAGAW